MVNQPTKPYGVRVERPLPKGIPSNPVDRYLKIVRWAERRYQKLGVAVFGKTPTPAGDRLRKLNRIEEMAFNKYCSGEECLDHIGAVDK